MTELRYALRVIRKSPGFAAVVILTLALGVGANTAIFSVVNAVLLRPFDFADPEGLVVVWERRVGGDEGYMFASPPNYLDWRERNRVFEEMGAYATRTFFLSGADETFRIDGARVSASLVRALGVAPVLGRTFTDDEDVPGGASVALIGHGLWQRRLSADPDVIGQSIELDNGAYTVIGVMAPSFDFPPPIDLEGGGLALTRLMSDARTFARQNEVWIPLAVDLAGSNRAAHYMTVIARLRAGVTREAAAAEMQTIAARLQQEHPETNREWSATVVPFDRVVVGQAGTALVVLMVAVSAVLLIACVNIANLLLARSTGRSGEYAVRAALGAGRRRLLRQAVIESQVLALIGGVAGLLLAWLGVSLIVRFAPPVPRLDQASVDAASAGYALVLAIVTGLLFGLAPALRAQSANLAVALRQGGRTSDSGAAPRVRAALVIAEVALSLVLLVGAGLLFNTFLAMRGVDTGVVADRVLTMRLTLMQRAYAEPEAVTGTWDEITRRVRALPGVAAAGLTLDVPLASDHQGTRLQFEGEPPPQREDNRSVHFSAATPGYFEAMGIPIVAGRGFTDADAVGAIASVIINDVLAQRFLPGQDPIGRRIEFGGLRTIVGVTGAVRLEQLTADATPAMIFPNAQMAPPYRNLSLAVRTRGAPLAMVEQVRDAIRSVDPAIPIYSIRTMEQVLADTVAQPRFSSAMLVVFSVVALLLAAIGIYGVIAFVVNQRTREIGIRMALGARPADALTMVVRQGMTLVFAGVLVGLALALALGRSLESLLFGVRPADPLTLAAVSTFLLLVALAACAVPALRASRVDPIRALKDE